jgi:hypothetical protein
MGRWLFRWRKSFAEEVRDSLRADRWARYYARQDALTDRIIETHERTQIPCADCEVGEPHACERAWWEEQRDRFYGRTA